MTIALVALLMRGLRSIERDEAAPEPEPEWWREFERELADYIARESGSPPVD